MGLTPFARFTYYPAATNGQHNATASSRGATAEGFAGVASDSADKEHQHVNK